jgi:hypothetical protein
MILYNFVQYRALLNGRAERLQNANIAKIPHSSRANLHVWMLQLLQFALMSSHTQMKRAKNHMPCVSGMLFKSAEAGVVAAAAGLMWGFKRSQLTLTARRAIAIHSSHSSSQSAAPRTSQLAAALADGWEGKESRPADASCANIPTRSLTHSRRRFLLAKNFARSFPMAQICAVA